MLRKRVVVAFGDIIGFRTWTRRAMTTPEESRDFIESFYRALEAYSLKTKAYVKFLGDGLMIVWEIEGGKNGDVARFLIEIYELALSIQNMIVKHYPRPLGIRFRVCSGYVWKIIMTKKRLGEKIKCAEYVGYVVNLAEHLLHVSPRVLCVCHESVVETMGSKKTGLRFEELEGPTELPRGVDPEDLAGLRSFRVESARDEIN